MNWLFNYSVRFLGGNIERRTLKKIKTFTFNLKKNQIFRQLIKMNPLP